MLLLSSTVIPSLWIRFNCCVCLCTYVLEFCEGISVCTCGYVCEDVYAYSYLINSYYLTGLNTMTVGDDERKRLISHI